MHRSAPDFAWLPRGQRLPTPRLKAGEKRKTGYLREVRSGPRSRRKPFAERPLVQSLAPRPSNRCSEAPAGHRNRCRETSALSAEWSELMSRPERVRKERSHCWKGEIWKSAPHRHIHTNVISHARPPKNLVGCPSLLLVFERALLPLVAGGAPPPAGRRVARVGPRVSTAPGGEGKWRRRGARGGRPRAPFLSLRSPLRIPEEGRFVRTRLIAPIAALNAQIVVRDPSLLGRRSSRRTRVGRA
jgi:hypothetical protein